MSQPDINSSKLSISERNLPPTPQGSIRELVRDPLNYFVTISRKYGDIICYRPTPDTAYLLNHPDYVRHILVDNHHNYNKRTYSNQAFKKFSGKSLVTLEGDEWLARRRLMQPAFHHSRLEMQDEIIVTATQEMLERWQESYKKSQPVDVAREMSALTMTITSRALFGVDLGEKAKAIGEMINGIAEIMEKSSHPKVQQTSREILAVIDTIIEERRKHIDEGDDLLKSLITTSEEKDGLKFNEQQLRYEVFGLLMAGYETTANALTWTFYMLSQNPSVLNHVREEVDKNLDGSRPDSANISKLPYLRMVFDESLRLFPPAWIIGRRAIDDDEIGGFHVPAGTVIAICIYALHRHPKYWENPDSFDPERFMPERSAGRDKYAYIPFSIGPRQCIGYSLGLLEARLILACVAQRFELRLLPGIEVKPQPLFVLRPNRDLLMSLHP